MFFIIGPIIAALTFLLQLFLPWWVIVPVAFTAAAWKAADGKHAFGAGSLAILLTWTSMVLYRTIINHNLLANRVGQMLTTIKWTWAWPFPILITVVLGGLIGGLSALSGYHFGKFVKKPE